MLLTLIRGTTPTLDFVLDDNIEDLNLDVLYMTFKQQDRVIIEKGINDVTISENIIKIELTQDETLSFRKNQEVRIQARMRTGNKAYATSKITISVDDTLKEGVI